MGLIKPWKPSTYSKYGAVRKTVDGINFDSTMEADFYEWAKDKYPEIGLQPKIKLLPGIPWKLDFLIEKEWYDVKGAETREFKIKKKLWALFGPGVLVVVKRAPGLSTPWSFERVTSLGYSLKDPSSK